MSLLGKSVSFIQISQVNQPTFAGILIISFPFFGSNCTYTKKLVLPKEVKVNFVRHEK